MFEEKRDGGKCMIKIAFFDTKDYDKKIFEEYNKNMDLK